VEAGGVVIGLLLQLEGRLADPDPGAELEGGGLGEPLGADVGAVGGAEVLDVERLPGAADAGVPRGDVVVVEADRRVSPAEGPSTTRTLVGAPRGGLVDFAPFCTLLARRWSRRLLVPVSIRAPNMSDRITEMAPRTKIHRIAR
jgi:hypothetical protein